MGREGTAQPVRQRQSGGALSRKPVGYRGEIVFPPPRHLTRSLLFSPTGTRDGGYSAPAQPKREPIVSPSSTQGSPEQVFGTSWQKLNVREGPGPPDTGRQES